MRLSTVVADMAGQGLDLETDFRQGPAEQGVQFETPAAAVVLHHLGVGAFDVCGYWDAQLLVEIFERDGLQLCLHQGGQGCPVRAGGAGETYAVEVVVEVHGGMLDGMGWVFPD